MLMINDAERRHETVITIYSKLLIHIQVVYDGCSVIFRLTPLTAGMSHCYGY